MNIFNSLGSNYNFKFALQALTALNKEEYKTELEKYLENKYKGKAILLYKCREAITLALEFINIPKGSFVAINGFTCFAVYEAIKKAGLHVEYLDIDDSLNFSPSTLSSKLMENPKIKVVIIQNTLGYPCELEKIANICKERKIILIEDLAHSIGTKYSNGLEAGTIGDLVVLSFSQDKSIDSVSGGALIIRSSAKLNHLEGGLRWHLPTKQHIDRLYPLFTYLIRKTYPLGIGKLLHFLLRNINLLPRPMNNLDSKLHQLPAWYCKLVKSQFEKLHEDLNHKKSVASIYIELINPKIVSQKISSAINLSSNLRFPIFVDQRETLIQYLEGHRIFISDIWYDAPIAPKKYLHLADYKGQCPNSEEISDQILNLPTHKNVSEKDAQNLSNIINQWLKSR